MGLDVMPALVEKDCGNERQLKTTTHPYVLPSGGSNTKAPRLYPHNFANTLRPKSSIRSTVFSLRTSRSTTHDGVFLR
eukprot:scaffold1468_cov206-Alexandrium_tamarense.AAC.1